MKLEEELFIELGFNPSPMLVLSIRRIEERIKQAKEEMHRHDDAVDRIWKTIDDTRDRVVFNRILGFTSRKRLAIDAANHHMRMSTSCASRIIRLRQNKDDELRMEFMKNRQRILMCNP